MSRKATEEQKKLIRNVRNLVQEEELTYDEAETWIKFLDLRKGD